MIRVQRGDFDVGAEIEALARGNAEVGGIASFVGVVRAGTGPDAVTSLTLEHYPGMTERALEQIEAEAMRRWRLAACLIAHRYGKLLPGERIVLVVTGAAHRKAAFEACEFLVDWLKTKAPFWKLETTKEGERWVEAKDSDDDAARRWVAE